MFQWMSINIIYGTIYDLPIVVLQQTSIAMLLLLGLYSGRELSERAYTLILVVTNYCYTIQYRML